MTMLKDFLISNFVLLCLIVVMVFYALSQYKQNKRISLCSIIISACCLILAISIFAQYYFKDTHNYYGTLICSIIGYTIRPACLYFFIIMNNKAYNGKWSFLIWIPLVINAMLYLCALIPGTKDLIFGFTINDDGSLSFSGGNLRFTSHILATLYLIYLVYLSIFTLKTKHIIHGTTILVCAVFVTLAVILETFVLDGDIDLLNPTIMVSTLTYYLFLYKEKSQIDTATGLFNRETYYHDLPRMLKTVTGIIHFDINGLKYLNDNFGHDEGDLCIECISGLIAKNIVKGMYAYRLGGDEFIVVVNSLDESVIKQTIDSFKKQLAKTKYYCSVGYSYDGKRTGAINDLIKKAEINMYHEKDKFYKESSIKRRQEEIE